jgi:hypothetical protein
MPETTAVQSILRADAPAPSATHRGKQPKMNANEVIKIGRKRNRVDAYDGVPLILVRNES